MLSDLKHCVGRLGRLLVRRDTWEHQQVRCPKLTLGNAHAAWCVCPKLICHSSVVYSFGVGDDVSFDLAMIEKFGVTVHAFDPTPRSAQWLRNQALPPRFIFHPFGVAAADGQRAFHPPADKSHISHSVLRREYSGEVIYASMLRLQSIMQMLGHEHIDVLKMDIEGAEYEVLNDLLENAIPVRQLLVEFHHRWPEIGAPKTERVIQRLNAAGYRIFNVSATGEEYSFLSDLQTAVPSHGP